MCGRPLIDGPSVTRHHLMPRSQGGRATEPMHRICHSKIHSLWDEKQLRDRYHTWEAILADEEIRAFVRWVRDKPPEFVSPNRLVRGHKRRKRR